MVYEKKRDNKLKCFGETYMEAKDETRILMSNLTSYNIILDIEKSHLPRGSSKVQSSLYDLS